MRLAVGSWAMPAIQMMMTEMTPRRMSNEHLKWSGRATVILEDMSSTVSMVRAQILWQPFLLLILWRSHLLVNDLYGRFGIWIAHRILAKTRLRS